MENTHKVVLVFLIIGVFLSGCSQIKVDSDYTKDPTYYVFIAEFSYFELKAQTTAIIGDLKNPPNTSFGIIDDSFKKRFEELGGKIVLETTINKEDYISPTRVFNQEAFEIFLDRVVAQVVEKNPDLVIFGDNDDVGVYSLILTHKLREQNFSGKIIFGEYGHTIEDNFAHGLEIPKNSANGIFSIENVNSYGGKYFPETIKDTGFVVLEWIFEGNIFPYGHRERYHK